jgi:hypothetical protein
LIAAPAVGWPIGCGCKAMTLANPAYAAARKAGLK